MESRESSSPIVTRAVAAGLHGKYANAYDFSAGLKLALKVLGGLPSQVGRYLIPRVQNASALDADLVSNLRTDILVRERLRDYDSLEGKFPAVTMGVALGGASAHLSLLTGGPFLPQAFVTTIKGGSPTGSVQRYFDLGFPVAQQVARNNPDLMTIQHYDPVHDGWLTRSVNHLRVKLLGLPAAYQSFIRERLQPGGEVIYLDGQAQWLRYRVGERSVFQVGGWGGLSAREFLEGSERIQRYCRSVGISEMDWRLAGYALEEGAESEWGSEAGLGEALEEFCRQEGFTFTRLRFGDPNNFSRLAFAATRRLLEKEGRKPSGVVVEMFSQFDATAAWKGGLLPLWLIFNTPDSLEFLRSMRVDFPQGLPVFFSPLSTFSLTPDLVGWDEWQKVLAGTQVVSIGARQAYFPADPRALVDWYAPLRAYVEQHPNPLQGRLTGADLAELAAGLIC